MKEEKAYPPTRLLLCVQGVPHESRGASTIIFWNYVAKLREMGFEILNLLFLEPQSFSAADLEEYISQVAQPGKFEVAPFWDDTVLRRDRFRLALEPARVTPAVERGRAFGPEVIFAVDILSAWIAHPIEARKRIVWLGDLNFDTVWYHAWYGARENLLSSLKLPTAWWKSYRWKKIYQAVLAKADLVLVASKSSEERLGRLGIRAKYLPYPWPEGPESRHYPVSPPDRPTFLFFGSLVGLGARSAFHFLLGALYPRLVRLWGKGGFHLLVGGRTDMPRWVREAMAAKPEISFLGFIEDLGSLFASCHAVIMPIEVPVGNRSRILSSMAQYAFIIAHENAALGNPDLRHGENCLLAKDAAGFVQEMRRAFENPAEREKIRLKARETYLQLFQPAVAKERFASEISTILLA